MATNYLYPSGETFLDPEDEEFYLLPSGTTTVQASAAPAAGGNLTSHLPLLGVG